METAKKASSVIVCVCVYVCVCVCMCVCVCVCVCSNAGTTLTGQQYTTYKLNAVFTDNPSLSLQLTRYMDEGNRGLMRTETV